MTTGGKEEMSICLRALVYTRSDFFPVSRKHIQAELATDLAQAVPPHLSLAFLFRGFLWF